MGVVKKIVPGLARDGETLEETEVAREVSMVDAAHAPERYPSHVEDVSVTSSWDHDTQESTLRFLFSASSSRIPKARSRILAEIVREEPDEPSRDNEVELLCLCCRVVVDRLWFTCLIPTVEGLDVFNGCQIAFPSEFTVSGSSQFLLQHNFWSVESHEKIRV